MQKTTIHWIFITKYFGSNFQNFHNCGNSGHTTDEDEGKGKLEVAKL